MLLKHNKQHLSFFWKIQENIRKGVRTTSWHCVKSVQIQSFFWSTFFRVKTEYWDLLLKSLYSARIRENTDQKKLHIWTLFTQCWGQSSVFISNFELSVVKSTRKTSLDLNLVVWDQEKHLLISVFFVTNFKPVFVIWIETIGIKYMQRNTELGTLNKKLANLYVLVVCRTVLNNPHNGHYLKK